MKPALAGLLLAVLPLAASAEPLDTALAAFDKEAAAPFERVRLFIERNGVADVYYIDRARPSRFRLAKNPRQGGPELIIVDGLQWERTAVGWRKAPAPPVAGLVPSMTGLFGAGLTEAVEQATPDGGSRIEGQMAWTNGASCDGLLTLQIDAAGLPSLLRFDGVCGGEPTRFRQAFSYAGPVTIVPPE